MMNHPLPSFLRKTAKGQYFFLNTHLKIIIGETFNLGNANEKGQNSFQNAELVGV